MKIILGIPLVTSRIGWLYKMKQFRLSSLRKLFWYFYIPFQAVETSLCKDMLGFDDIQSRSPWISYLCLLFIEKYGGNFQNNLKQKGLYVLNYLG